MSHVMITLAIVPALKPFSKLLFLSEMKRQGWVKHTLYTYSKDFVHEMNMQPIAAMVNRQVQCAVRGNSVSYTAQIGDSPIMVVNLPITSVILPSTLVTLPVREL